MQLEYTIVALAVGLLYAIFVNIFPDFPLPEPILLNIVVWLLLMLGIDVVGRPVARKIRELRVRLFGPRLPKPRK